MRIVSLYPLSDEGLEDKKLSSFFMSDRIGKSRFSAHLGLN